MFDALAYGVSQRLRALAEPEFELSDDDRDEIGRGPVTDRCGLRAVSPTPAKADRRAVPPGVASVGRVRPVLARAAGPRQFRHEYANMYKLARPIRIGCDPQRIGYMSFRFASRPELSMPKWSSPVLPS